MDEVKMTQDEKKECDDAFAVIMATKEVMAKIDKAVSVMTDKEFAMYVTLVEVPHTNALKIKKEEMEKQNEKS